MALVANNFCPFNGKQFVKALFVVSIQVIESFLDTSCCLACHGAADQLGIPVVGRAELELTLQKLGWCPHCGRGRLGASLGPKYLHLPGKQKGLRQRHSDTDLGQTLWVQRERLCWGAVGRLKGKVPQWPNAGWPWTCSVEACICHRPGHVWCPEEAGSAAWARWSRGGHEAQSNTLQRAQWPRCFSWPVFWCRVQRDCAGLELPPPQIN